MPSDSRNAGFALPGQHLSPNSKQVLSCSISPGVNFQLVKLDVALEARVHGEFFLKGESRPTQSWGAGLEGLWKG